MFFETKMLEVQECHTLTQRDLKYTLLRFSARVVQSKVSSFMCYLDEKYGIKSSSVFGYPAISMGFEIDEHPGMALIAHAMNTDSPDLSCWMAEGNAKSNPKGLLFDHLSGLPDEAMTRAQLLNRVRLLKGDLSECKFKIAELELVALQNDSLQNRIRSLERRLEQQIRIFTREGRASELLPTSP